MWLYKQEPIKVKCSCQVVLVSFCGFSLSRNLARPCDQRFMWLYGQWLINITHHPVMIGGYMHCGSDDIMILVCHVILQNHVIEGP